MDALVRQLVDIFSAPAGQAALLIALLAVIGLVVAVFWDAVRMPLQDRLRDAGFRTVKPPPITPSLAARSQGAADLHTNRPLLIRNGILLAVLAGMVVLAVMAGRTIAEDQRRAAFAEGQAGEGTNVSAPGALGLEPAMVLEASSDGGAWHGGGADCGAEGSLLERSVDLCARDAAVRADLLRLVSEGRPLARPVWNAAAPSFIEGESHAAPLRLMGDTVFAAPETVPAKRYDAYLVVGVAKAGEDQVAELRRKTLEAFAVAQLTGGDRAACLGKERIYSVSATFVPETAEALARQKELAALLAEKRSAAAQHVAADLERQALAMEPLVTHVPAPIMVGLKADRFSSDPDQDMQEAARQFLASYGAVLQITDEGPITAIDACTRGDGAL